MEKLATEQNQTKARMRTERLRIVRDIMEHLRMERFGAEQKGSERSIKAPYGAGKLRERKGSEWNRRAQRGSKKARDHTEGFGMELRGLERTERLGKLETNEKVRNRTEKGSERYIQYTYVCIYNIHICSQFEHFGDFLRTPVAPLMSPSPVCLSAEGAKNVSGP